MQPKLYSILDVDPDRAKICALWVLLGATDWHIHWHNLPDRQVLVVAGALVALASHLAATLGGCIGLLDLCHGIVVVILRDILGTLITIAQLRNAVAQVIK
jgi:hypothetical protein